MKQEIDLQTWKRKDHYEFFKTFDEPLFGMTVNLNCDRAYQKAKSEGYSFFLYYLYQALKAANLTEEFRLRIEEDKVYCYPKVGAGPTILRADGTFGYGWMEYKTSFEEFLKCSEKEVSRVQNERGLHFPYPGEDIIHFSTIPWMSFTAFSHARAFNKDKSIPKIVFGKLFSETGNRLLPVSIHVNHALMDGYHLGQYVDLFQTLLNE